MSFGGSLNQSHSAVLLPHSKITQGFEHNKNYRGSYFAEALKTSFLYSIELICLFSLLFNLVNQRWAGNATENSVWIFSLPIFNSWLNFSQRMHRYLGRLEDGAETVILLAYTRHTHHPSCELTQKSS